MAVTSTGCEGSLAAAQPSAPAQPAADLPRYDARAAELFDDAIEPDAVGFRLAATGTVPDDTVMRERTQAADAVVRARVVTVTSNRDDSGPAWQIGLATVDVLASARTPATGSRPPPPTTFTWLIRSRDPAAGIVRASEGAMVGKTLVAFLRTFAGPPSSDGAPTSEIHFHAAPDSKKEIEGVRSAAALGEFR